MFPWLTVVVLAPLVGAAVVAALPRGRDGAARWVALVTTVGTFVVAVGIVGAYDGSRSGFQLVERAVWVRSLNFQYVVGVDGISLFLVVLTAFLMPLSILASWTVGTRVKAYMVAMLVLETAMIGSFVALDLLLFFLFFEALLFPMYLIIGGWGSERRVYAAVKFFLYTMAGSAFLFVAILFLYFRAGSEVGRATFDFTQLVGLPLSVAAGRWLFLAFFVAFAVKVPLFPLHTWLPDAHTEAPTAGSVLLAGVLLKVGAYGLLRFNLSLFPEASEYFRVFVSTLAVVGIVYGAVVAMVQRDVKRLVAYSSVSHLGFVVLGTFAFTLQGMSGGVLQMVNHGLSTGALFLLVGMLYERSHTRDLDALGGMGKTVPLLSGFFLLVALSSLGLPGLNGFVGEFLILLGSFARHRALTVVGATGVILSAIYLLWAYQRMAHGEPRGDAVRFPDLSLRELVILVPMVAAIVFIGVYPKPLLERIEPSVRDAGAAVMVRDAGPAVAEAGGQRTP
ncbi:MAG TPA: NADH-quinone oxidoreductase subunit M [Actinomycetota bacterium]|nr:NADH-quinone oxidoreductase subunit M [Actinomycetota bacterium]